MGDRRTRRGRVHRHRHELGDRASPSPTRSWRRRRWPPRWRRRHRAGSVTIEICPVEGLPEIRAGDDLAAMLAEPLRAMGREDGDIVAVTQKIVSKAEGRVVPEGRGTLGLGRPRDAPGRRSPWRPDHRGDAPWVRLRERRGGRVQRRGGFRLAAAARSRRVARSPPGVALTGLGLPARGGDHRHVRTTLAQRLVNVAIGCAGFPALVDLRGRRTSRPRSWRSRSSPSRTRWRPRAAW